jgi:carboxylesterase type B
MSRTWTSFAASGDPNGSEPGAWEPYERAADNHLDLDVDASQATGFRDVQCDFWEPYL